MGVHGPQLSTVRSRTDGGHIKIVRGGKSVMGNRNVSSDVVTPRILRTATTTIRFSFRHPDLDWTLNLACAVGQLEGVSIGGQKVIDSMLVFVFFRCKLFFLQFDTN